MVGAYGGELLINTALLRDLVAPHHGTRQQQCNFTSSLAIADTAFRVCFSEMTRETLPMPHANCHTQNYSTCYSNSPLPRSSMSHQGEFTSHPSSPTPVLSLSPGRVALMQQPLRRQPARTTSVRDHVPTRRFCTRS